MKIKLLFPMLILTAFSTVVFGQKAEPNRINFAKGKTSAVSSGTLKTGEEYDFVIGAKAGQKVSLKVTALPKGNLFDFTVAGDGFDFKTDAESYNNFTLTAPETGDYLVTVRKRPLNKLPKAKFFLNITIR